MAKKENNYNLNTISNVQICDACLDGAGGECHTPGCILWINRAPDIPIRGMIIGCGGQIVKKNSEHQDTHRVFKIADEHILKIEVLEQKLECLLGEIHLLKTEELEQDLECLLDEMKELKSKEA